MPQLRDLITGDRGLLPFLETRFGTTWNNFQIRRFAPGKLQGFRATSDRLSTWGQMETTGRREQSMILGYQVLFGVAIDGTEMQMVAAEFRDELDRAVLEWAASRPNLVCENLESISGLMSFNQPTGQEANWQVTVVREFSLSYLTS